MKHPPASFRLLPLAFILLPLSFSLAQSTGDYILIKKTATGRSEVTLSPNASNLLRFDGSGGVSSVAAADLTGISASNITTGSLGLARLAQGGATTGQILTWTGSAWAAQDAAGGVQLDDANTWTAAQTFTAANTTGAVKIAPALSNGAATYRLLEIEIPDGSAYAGTTTFLRMMAGSSQRIGFSADGSITTGASVNLATALYAETLALHNQGWGFSRGLIMAGGYAHEIMWTDGASIFSDIDLRLGRIGPGILGVYRGTSPAEVQIYSTKTSGTNYERGFIGFRDDIFTIGTEAGAGGGTVRALKLSPATIILSALPTSSSGLPSGALWNDSNTVKIVP